MPLYWTGLSTDTNGDEPFESKRCCGAGWEALVAPAPSFIENSFRSGIHIRAGSWETAQKALELIWSAVVVFRNDESVLDHYPQAVRSDGVNEGQPLRWTNVAGRWQLSMTCFPRACRVAAKASRNRDFAYALLTLAVSQGLATRHHMELDPSNGPSDPAISPFHLDHVRCAYAIVASYAVLEQLGLELRASVNRPSRPGGRWTPEVRKDLEDRLRRRGVNLDETALWTIRGPKRRVDRGRTTQVLSKASWAWGAVRDQEVEVVDAIADLSWLRSRVSSHRLGKDALSLSIYDVANAQYLARRLFFEVLGFWRDG